LIDLAIAVACGLGIAVIFKHAAQRGMDRLSLLTANYLTASLISLAMLDADRFIPEAGFVLLCVLTGGLFISGFFMLALATSLAGMSLATAIMRISVVIPFVASWAIWSEVPSAYQFIGLIVGGAAFVLISSRPAGMRTLTGVDAAREMAHSRRTMTVLLLLFLIGGLIDTLMKTFDEVFAQVHSRSAFMLIVFGTASVIGLVIVIARRRRPLGATLVWGVVLGLVNIASVEFILRAIRQLSGPFVFPANNILLVIGSALLGVFFWKERLTVLNGIGLILAAAALVLLNF